MVKLPGRYLTSIAMVALGVATFFLASLYYRHGVVIYGPDAEDILAPLFYDISRAIHSHGLLAGMYDPGQVAGLSLWNVPYFHALYPFYFNWLGTDASIFDTVARLRWVDFLHLAIYGSGCYLLSRSIGVRQALALAIGLVSPWFPAVQSTLHWPQILASLAWVPWILACQMWLYKGHGKQQMLSALGLTLSFSLLVYAQPAQNMVLVVVGSVVVWMCLAISTWRNGQPEERSAFVRATVAIGIAGILAVFICGEYLISVVIYLGKAIRWLGNNGVLIGKGRMPLDAMREYALAPSDADALLVYSSRHTVIVGNLYIGASMAVCAVLGFFAGRGDRRIAALLVSALVTVLFCFGFFTPLLRWIPIANKVREVNWWSCYAVTVLLALGGYGLQCLFEQSVGDASGKSFKKRALWALLAGNLATLLLLPVIRAELMLVAALLASASFASLAICLVFPDRTRQFHQAAAVAVVLLSVVVPVLANERAIPRLPTLMDAGHMQTRNEALQIAKHIGDGENYRFAVSPKIPNYKNFTVTLANLDLRGIRGDISPQEYDKFRLLFFPTTAVADLYGVKYQIVPSQPSRDDDIKIDDKVSLRVNLHALPRLFFVQGGIEVVKSPVDTLLGAPDSKVPQIYVTPKDLPLGIDPAQQAATSPKLVIPHLLVNGATELRGLLETQGSGVLVLNEDIAGRWRATIDGRRVDPFRVNGFQTAFLVNGAGMHTIEISRPGALL